METKIFQELYKNEKTRVAGYVRLSRDEDKKSYSSIINQKDLIINYIKNFNDKEGEKWELFKIFEDDNVSGYTFKRPGFNELITALESNKIDILIAKDLSRIGRHNAKTLLFLENIKKINKRCILIEEGHCGYDTISDEDDIIGIKTWYNERYIKDISKKIKSSLKTIQMKGEFLIEPPYAYNKIEENKGRVIIDEDKANVVRDIFNRYIDGWGYKKIAVYLTNNCVPTPSQTRKRNYKKASSGVWNIMAIKRILRSDFYVGTYRANMAPRNGVHGKPKKTSVREHIIIQNHHDAIIDKATFDLAKEISKKREIFSYRSNSKDVNNIFKPTNLFASLLFCEDCNSRMTCVRVKEIKAYRCNTYNKNGRKFCSSHYVREDFLIEALKAILNDIKEHAGEIIKNNDHLVKEVLSGQNNYNVSIRNLEKKLLDLQNEQKIYLSQKIRDIGRSISMEEKKLIIENYDSLIDENFKKISSISSQINEVKESKNDNINIFDNSESALVVFTSMIEKHEFGRGHLEKILDKIIISEDGTPEFHLKPEIKIIMDNIHTSNTSRCMGYTIGT